MAEPEVPTARDELPILLTAAVGVVAVAWWTDPGPVLWAVPLLVAVAAFAARGLVPRLPSEVFAVAVVGPVTLVVLGSGHFETVLFLNVTMVLYASWHLGSTTRAVVLTLATAAVPFLAAVVTGSSGSIGWGPWTLACGFTFILGRVLHRQRRLIEELELARLELARQAVADERRRIARELHDLAGHTLAAVLLHVTGARHVLRRDVDDAERALADAEAVGRASLDQIRTTVAALRTDERGTDPALADSTDLPALVDEYRRAGLRIDVVTVGREPVDTELVGPVAGWDGPTATAVHRILREALANVARHASTNRVVIELGVIDDTVHLVVTDQGVAGRSPEPAHTHFGLLGMGERARAMGGDLTAGPTADGWRVDARLPATGPRVGASPS